MAQGVSLEFKTLYCKKKIPWLALVTAVTPLPAKTFYVKLFVIVTKYLRRIFKGRNYSFWLTVSEVSVHYGRESIIEQNNSQHGGQEAKKERIPVLAFILPGSHGMVPTTFSEGGVFLY
jgi:hypothetical protein